MPECQICNKELRTEQGLNAHITRVHDSPWTEESVLKQLYLDEKMNAVEIADKFGVGKKTIHRWLGEYNIEMRDSSLEKMRNHSAKPATFETGFQGYEKWRFKHKNEHIHVKVHQLLAVSEYGTEELAGNVVHHKNGIPWDNRPENIEVMTDSEHSRLHMECGDTLNK